MQRTGGAWSPDVFAERDSFTPEPLAAFRKAAEDTVLAAAGDGVRAMVVRPGLIWGPATTATCRWSTGPSPRPGRPPVSGRG
ncbi:hypothetical protein ABZ384_00460 [Streptomyces cyaneofuscatus]|uniref:hypothetical protein n=1 Tax=Streptomyces cyaneofuscatus TaxID=66883 RepID=UPI0033D3D9C7